MIEKKIIKEKVDAGYSIRQLSTEFNTSYSAIRYVLKKYELNTAGYKKINNWEKEKLIDAIKFSECKSDILRNLGIKIKSGNFQTLDRYCTEYQINISHLKYKNDRGFKYKTVLSNEDLFVENSSTPTKTVRLRIYKEKLKKYECVMCQNKGLWNGKKLSLQLDHINGINNDHRLENLRWLCPNCHSQTATFSGKNKMVL